MRVIRNIKTQIDLNNMNQLFSGDIEGIVTSRLKQQCIGKCQFGCMILNIRDVKTSECRIDPASGIGSGYVCVAFNAEVLELTTDECVIIKIISIHNNILLARNDDLKIVTLLKRDNLLKIAQVGQYIPIRVLKREFTPGKDIITVNSALYTLPKDSYIFQIDPLTDDDKEELEPLIDTIKDLLKKLKKMDNKLIKFFNDMLYPYNKKPTLKTEENMMDLSSSGLVCRHHAIDKLTPSILVLKKTDENIISQSAILVYKSFLNDYRNHILTIIYMCDHFNTPEMRKENDVVWQIYKKYKTSYD